MTHGNVSALFDAGVCVICAQPRTPDGEAAHVSHHLATGEAVRVLDYSKTPREWRVVPTSTMPASDADGSVWDSDGDTWLRQDTNSEALRQALAKGRDLNRQTARRIAAAQRKGAA